MNSKVIVYALISFVIVVGLGQLFMRGTGDVQTLAGKGREVFGLCVNCHSMAAGDHRSGPSLRDVVGRRAGSAARFARYSPAMRNAGIVWSPENLDSFLRKPARFLPGNIMVFAGISSARERTDLIIYLTEAKPDERNAPGSSVLKRADLKQAGPETRITYCGDAYNVVTALGVAHRFWEFNLRFKTDGTSKGPPPGAPALIQSGSSGDRAYAVFAAPEEISAFVERVCPPAGERR